MQTRNKLFDDAARLAGGAAGTLAGIRREIEALVRQQMERVLSSMDFVTRDEFDAVREMAITARKEQEALTERLAKLETKAQKSGSAAAKSRAAPRRKKADDDT